MKLKVVRRKAASVLQVQFFELELQLYEYEHECQLSPLRNYTA